MTTGVPIVINWFEDSVDATSVDADASSSTVVVANLADVWFDVILIKVV